MLLHMSCAALCSPVQASRASGVAQSSPMPSACCCCQSRGSVTRLCHGCSGGGCAPAPIAATGAGAAAGNQGTPLPAAPLPLPIMLLLVAADVISSSALLPVIRRSTTANRPLSSPSMSCCSCLWLHATDHTGAWVGTLRGAKTTQVERMQKANSCVKSLSATGHVHPFGAAFSLAPDLSRTLPPLHVVTNAFQDPIDECSNQAQATSALTLQ